MDDVTNHESRRLDTRPRRKKIVWDTGRKKCIQHSPFFSCWLVIKNEIKTPLFQEDVQRDTKNTHTQKKNLLANGLTASSASVGQLETLAEGRSSLREEKQGTLYKRPDLEGRMIVLEFAFVLFVLLVL